VDSLDVFEKEKDSLKNVLEISYEDFTEKPDAILSEITSFLGVKPFQESISEKSFSVHEKSSSIKNMNSRSLSKLSEQEIQTINKIAGISLQKYNYQVL